MVKKVPPVEENVKLKFVAAKPRKRYIQVTHVQQSGNTVAAAVNRNQDLVISGTIEPDLTSNTEAEARLEDLVMGYIWYFEVVGSGDTWQTTIPAAVLQELDAAATDRYVITIYRFDIYDTSCLVIFDT